MRITRYTDYSLRVLIYVALKGKEISTIAEIADAYGISKNHLMKVVQELNNKKYLIALRGKNGGLQLNGRPEDINIGVLIRDIEEDIALVECFGDENECVITPACQLKFVLKEALAAFFNVLDQHSLADLLPTSRKKELIKLLQVFSD